MTESKAAGDRRAPHVALVGCVVQLAAFGAVLGIALWSDSEVLGALSRFALIGVPLWFILYLVFNQMHRVGVEALETEEFRRASEAGVGQGIFELDDEALLIEQNRLKWMVTWLLPVGTILVSLLLLMGHFVGWGWSLDQAFDKNVVSRTQQPTLMMWVVIGVGFISFLYSRYALALARLPQWGLLRAGAVCMVGNALACVVVAVGLMAAGTIPWAEPLVAYVLRLALVVLGVEFAVNFVLDLYKPRVPGEVPRPSFDSRLLGMIGEPGGIAKSIADAVNYQFGFQVSSTWFYQLLQRWLFPIMVVALAAVLALTSVVIVDADEVVVVERFGRLIEKPTTVLTPGLHFKWPYPIDVVYRAPVKRISELVIGEAAEEDDEDLQKAILWTEKHEYVPELMLLVASPKLEGASVESGVETSPEIGLKASEAVAVSLLMVSVPIEYRIKDIVKYVGRYEDPKELLEAAAYQYLSLYAASVDIDELMGPGREAFNEELKGLIQDRLDQFDAGIEVVFVGIRGAHPPSKGDVAAAFQSVVSAQTSMSTTIHRAQGEAQKILTSMAGSVARATALDEAIRTRDELAADSPQLAQARQQVEWLLMGNPAKDLAPASGEAAKLIAESRAIASERTTQAAALARMFGTQVAAYEAAPELYRQRKILEVYGALGSVRKYLIVGDPSNVIIEYETAKEAGLDQVLSEGVEKERKKREGSER